MYLFIFSKPAKAAALLLLCAMAAPSFAQRFSGSATARQLMQQSADQRFRMHANLWPPGTQIGDEKPQSTDGSRPKLATSEMRFAISARLADASAPLGSLTCGAAPTDDIFKNGFEN